MTTKLLEPANEVLPQELDEKLQLQRGACVEFVKFCKEQHINARAAQTFLRVLHNKSWEIECEKIRAALIPEIDAIFAPVERSLAAGVPKEDVLTALIDALKKTEAAV